MPGAFDLGDLRQSSTLARLHMEFMVEALRCGGHDAGRSSSRMRDWEAQAHKRLKIEGVYCRISADIIDKLTLSVMRR